MKSIVYTHVVGFFTFPNPVTIFQNRSTSEKLLINERRRKRLNHDT